jgi:protein-L-isoaspartate(D-aspartate) O-methyltransferase
MSTTIADQEGFAAFLLRMRARGISDKALLAAVEAVPRRNFVPGQWQDAVWLDQMIPIDCGETLEGLDLQATAIAALGLHPNHRVLEIGTGSGYTTAILAKLGGRVISLDRYKRLLDQARQRIDALGLTNVMLRQGDGSKGLGAEGPFDRIIVWAAFPEMPRHFVDQLSMAGVMVAAIGPGEGAQDVVRLTKTGSRFERDNIGKVRLQPLREGVAAAI